MKPIILGRSVQGASHRRSASEIDCQDSFCYNFLKFNVRSIEYDAVVLAVSDGHGSKSCPYSKDGAQLAARTFCDIIEDVCRKVSAEPESVIASPQPGKPLDNISAYLEREGEVDIPKRVLAEWQRRVLDRTKSEKRVIAKASDGTDDFVSLYRQYGTTLLGLLITEEFFFGFQLGDGDICFAEFADGYEDKITVEKVVEPRKILGVETDSLCSRDAWTKANVVVLRKSVGENVLFTLSTDGYSNSYPNDSSFRIVISDYLRILRDNGHPYVSQQLEGWLRETSDQGSGDDVTFLAAFFPRAPRLTTKSGARHRHPKKLAKMKKNRQYWKRISPKNKRCSSSERFRRSRGH